MSDPPLPQSPATVAPGSGPPAKAALRRQFRTRRREVLAAAMPGLQAVARQRLPSLLPPAAWLGLYLPVGSEPDLDPWAAGGLADRRRAQLIAAAGPAPGSGLCQASEVGTDALAGSLDARLALPAVLPPRPGEAQGRLVYLPWPADAPLRPDACGIPAPLPADGREPVPLPPEALGLLLVPALSVDRRGLRLGSGGGWYDRLRSDPAWRSVPALAVLPAACVVERLPADPWDVPFNGWLDETGLWPLQPFGLPD